jgi:hypothetical protein
MTDKKIKHNTIKNISSEIINKKTFSLFEDRVFINSDFTNKQFLSLYDIENAPQFYEWLDNNIDNNNIISINRIINAFIYEYNKSIFVVNNSIILFVKKYLNYLINENLFYMCINYINVVKNKDDSLTCCYIDKYENLYKEYEYIEIRKKFFVDDMYTNLLTELDYEELTNYYFNVFFNIEIIDNKEVIKTIHDFLIIKFNDNIVKYIIYRVSEKEKEKEKEKESK